jgi:predicted DNA-binding transcriptional regulator AlpA
MPDLLSANDLIARYNICLMTLYRWRRDRNLHFPPPIKWRGRVRWRASDITAFEESRRSLT